MSRPTLYIGLHGPLLVPAAKPNEYLGAGIADYAKPFLTWAKDRFDIQVLTDENLRHVHHLTEHLGLPADKINPRGFETSKVEVMQPGTDFYWVDAALIPGELSWLTEHGHYDRFLAVDPTVGVTPRHKDVLEGLTRNRRNH